MLRTLRATAPAGLVPLAWGFAAAAHTGSLGSRSVLIGHAVMATLLVAFALLSWRDMRGVPVLRVWLAVVLAGVPVTLTGAYGVLANEQAITAVAVGGWMVLPATALGVTARAFRRDDRGAWRSYALAAAVAGAGAVVFALTATPGVDERLVLVAIAAAGAGQTLGILRAAWPT